MTLFLIKRKVANWRKTLWQWQQWLRVFLERSTLQLRQLWKRNQTKEETEALAALATKLVLGRTTPSEILPDDREIRDEAGR